MEGNHRSQEVQIRSYGFFSGILGFIYLSAHVQKTGVRFCEHLFFVDFYNLRKLVLPVLSDFSHLAIDFAYIGAILPHIKKKCYLFFTNFFVKIGDCRIKLERRKDFEGQICGQNPAEFDKNIRIGGKIRRDCLGSDSWSYTSKSLVFQILFCRFRRLQKSAKSFDTYNYK